MKLDNVQQNAINLIINSYQKKLNKFLYITGPAGSGKTTIINNVIEYFEKIGAVYALAAPTGKAAKRISHVTNKPASTIHRLLQFTMPNKKDVLKEYKSYPKINSSNPLILNVLILDEYSMVNKKIHDALMNAIKNVNLVLFIGDLNQLTPIENIKDSNYESPFSTIIKKYKGITLTKVYRSDNMIPQTAFGILNNQIPTENNNVFIFKGNDSLSILKNIIHELKNDIHFNDISNQIILPTNKGELGTYSINKLIQKLLNNNNILFSITKNIKSLNESIKIDFKINDKIICTENFSAFKSNDEMNDIIQFFNGETGIIKNIKDNIITIDFGDRIEDIPTICYNYDTKTKKFIKIMPFEYIELGYAITVHKSQGDQYNNVIFLSNKKNSYNVNKSMAYTAISRAKNNLFIITDDMALKNMINEKSFIEQKIK